VPRDASRSSLGHGHASVAACALSLTGQDFYPRDALRAEGNDGLVPLPQTNFPEEERIMLKLSFWIGTPSIITYLASTYSQLLENIFYIFALSAAALIVAILSQISEKSGS
jgi:hypothetical protein